MNVALSRIFQMGFFVDIFTDFIFYFFRVLLLMAPNWYSIVLESIKPHCVTFNSFTIYALISINWGSRMIWQIFSDQDKC